MVGTDKKPITKKKVPYDPGSEESNNYQNAALLSEHAERLPGFPFSEAWPRLYVGRRYEIILVNGHKLDASVDDARELMSEGLEWKTNQGNKAQSVVAGWKRIA